MLLRGLVDYTRELRSWTQILTKPEHQQYLTESIERKRNDRKSKGTLGNGLKFLLQRFHQLPV